MQAGDNTLYKKLMGSIFFVFCVAAALFVPVLLIVLNASGKLGNAGGNLGLSWPVAAIIDSTIVVFFLLMAFAFGLFKIKITSDEVSFGLWWFPRKFARADLLSFRPYDSAEYLHDDHRKVKPVCIQHKISWHGVKLEFKGAQTEFAIDVPNPEEVCAALEGRDLYHA
jgi:hypothetical protein